MSRSRFLLARSKKCTWHFLYVCQIEIRTEQPDFPAVSRHRSVPARPKVCTGHVLYVCKIEILTKQPVSRSRLGPARPNVCTEHALYVYRNANLKEKSFNSTLSGNEVYHTA